MQLRGVCPTFPFPLLPLAALTGTHVVWELGDEEAEAQPGGIYSPPDFAGGAGRCDGRRRGPCLLRRMHCLPVPALALSFLPRPACGVF